MAVDYKWDEESGKVIVTDLNDFNLMQTLECGQCFRWDKQADGSYTGVALGKVLNVRQDGQRLYFTGCSILEFEELWRNYFDLDRDYGAIKKRLSTDDPIMQKAIAFGSGIRLLKQDEWETLISFIISQNSNIPRIRKCIASLCETYGRKIQDAEGRIFHAFPEPSELGVCTMEEVQACRLGYRSRYILETARQVMEDPNSTLYKAHGLSGQDAEKYLLGLSGVGPKVADCVLLFSMGHFDRFPADVWMKRAMALFYGLDEKDAKGIAAFAGKRFGELGGFAQQYLFNYMRLEQSKQTV